MDWTQRRSNFQLRRKKEGKQRDSRPRVERRRRRTAEKKLGELFSQRRDRRIPPSSLQASSPRKDHSDQRRLSLQELQEIMATFARPVASSISGIDFGVYNDADIKAISVKRIHNTPTLDSFNNPVPGGLYDPAMGAWSDHV